ncbi:MAG TPA: carboxypeptidase-like regulatory domain-containing protein, partial [Daejeonella sp.]|nr:carboxypeptidase-like regulatory domain-containing protein [Daejeonella sp.]
MKSKLLLSILVVAISILPLATMAQITASGRVIEASTGQGLQGVTVKVKGSLTGTATGTNGSFSLNNVPENAILEFSFLG